MVKNNGNRFEFQPDRRQQLPVCIRKLNNDIRTTLRCCGGIKRM